MAFNGNQSMFAELKDDFTRMPLKELGKRIFKKIGDDDVPTLSAAFAYYWVFAIPPLLILIVLIASLLNTVTDIQVVENLRETITDRAPADTQELLLRLVDQAVEQVGGGIASFGAIATALLALWAASNSVNILITGFNRAYDVRENRGYVRKKAVSLGLTLLIVVFVNLAFALLVFGRQIGEWIADWVGLGSVFDTWWGIARWPAAVLGVMLLTALLYWLGPNVDQPFRLVSVGSLVATLLWLIVVAGFGLYLSVSNPGSAYGVVGSVIVLLFFLNISGMVFFLGAEINSILFAAVADRPASAFRGPAMAVANQ
jgi:membrane protein